MKTCTHCKREKPLDQFRKLKRARDGLQSWCNSCINVGAADWAKRNPERRKEHNLKWRTANREIHKARKYGITVEELLALESKTECDLCGLTKPLVIDHCHSTGVVRGTLCRDCNTSLGKLGDTVEALERAVEYLKRKMM